MRFERHLDECADCAAEVLSLREAAALVSLDESAPLPPQLRDRVLSSVAEIRPLPPVAPHEAVRDTARRFPRLVAAVAAAVILVAGVGIGNWHPWAPQPPSEVTSASQVLDAADAQHSTARMPGGGRATVVHSASLDRVVVMTENLPQAPADRVYELWLQDAKGVMRPSGTLSGGSDTTVVLRGAVKGSTGVGITLEPAGGSQKPTTSPLALFPLAQA
ncbi:hypothetical protein GCM10011519_29860 [Marmoricola endophyticus]|uniref:Regulator of SigK n=1 Tax=Marmoricola endophyticus TaxID=2040280 RepID=A0A917F5G2_9ACTN|nr:hypothetical protein GCM10011519_29860 [Marmoricola endophyticus]